MKRKLTSLLLAIVMALALLPTTAFAATVVDRVKVSMTAPTVGKPLPQNLKTSSDSSAELTGFQWEGELDSDGNMMGGTNYTLTFSLKIKSGKSAKFPKNNSTLRVVFNGTLTATITEMTDKKASGTLTFFINERGKMEKPAAPAKYFTKAEADANYPSPITLVVNDQTLDVSDLGPYSKGVKMIVGFRMNKRAVFHTLEGEAISNDLPYLDTGAYKDTINPYRVTRVVYDLYRKDDPSIATFPNNTELWLSPKCDIQGILDNIARDYGKSGGCFNTWNYTVFIPDTLYPNGPTYTSGSIPRCRVMLYSGSDVYAAARAGKAAARDWCTNHTYTYAFYKSPVDRRYSTATCQSDERYYYSCSKCGKCEQNPNHTYFDKGLTNDNGEGRYSAHIYYDRIPTDEHFLGLNANGDRVYLECCVNCGIDERQEDTQMSFARYKANINPEATQADWKNFLEKRKKVWEPGGSYYNSAIKATLEKDGLHNAYAIAADKFITAKTSGWAKSDVQEASNEDLVDLGLMGNDYTKTISRLQFCSVAVKLAEKMTGKAITPAPSGTFSDTDSEYVRKAYAASITTGAGGGKFNPSGTLTRQEMAAFLYRALMYVKANSDTKYTIWESKLGNYTDAGQLAGWAKNEMAFMNALGLINGMTTNTLAPTKTCTIEQALVVAYRSLDAGGIGWYQCVASPWGNLETYGGAAGTITYAYGDRVWFTSSEGHCVDPYGRSSSVVAKHFYPIKDC